MSRFTVLDLFCGAGGLSAGFAKAGYDVRGVDYAGEVPTIFKRNGLGMAHVQNLHHTSVNGGYDVVVGGPPCRPWSSVNLVKRDSEHESHRYITRFGSHVLLNRPQIFLMENVPPARKLAEQVGKRLSRAGYDVRSKVFCYSDYGAPTSRRRLVMWGALSHDAVALEDELGRYKSPATTVRDAISYLSEVERGTIVDHDYPDFQTIESYIDRYESGQFGWYRLTWDRPAPSFGNIMKTYTLHPDSWEDKPARVLSVKEALLLMGFDREFTFPPEMGIAQKYQMVADSVSPVFSYSVARAIRRLL